MTKLKKTSSEPKSIKRASCRDNLTRLNANIPVELHTSLKMRAAKEGTAMGALIENWIAGWSKAA